MDRIDNNSDYCPANCRYVTRKENSRNRRGNKRIDVNGEMMLLTDIAKLANVSQCTITDWIQKGILHQKLRDGKSYSYINGKRVSKSA